MSTSLSLSLSLSLSVCVCMNTCNAYGECVLPNAFSTECVLHRMCSLTAYARAWARRYLREATDWTRIAGRDTRAITTPLPSKSVGIRLAGHISPNV